MRKLIDMEVIPLNPINYVNATLEIIGVLVSFGITIFFVANEFSRGRSGRIFLCLLICNTVCLFFDSLFCLLLGSMNGFAGTLLRVSTFATYFISYIFVPLFVAYVVEIIRQKKPFSRLLVYITAVCCAVVTILLVLSLFNGMFYSFDEQGIYHRGDLYWLSQAVMIVFAVVSAAVAVHNRKFIGTRNTLYLLSYIAMSALALLISMFFYGLALLGIATTVSLVIIYLGIPIQQARLLKEKELELAESRIAAMLSQIKPHFLYNSLTVIKHLCRSDPALAEETVVEFSQYLRGNLDSLSIKTPIPFARERSHVETYLALEKKRFGDKLNIVYDIRAQDFPIPALSLQTIVENAVHYGITKRERGGTLTITTEETEYDHRITVADDGVGFDPDMPKQDGRSHVGIENTRNRIWLMCGGSLSIRSEMNAGTTAVISIPKGETRR